MTHRRRTTWALALGPMALASLLTPEPVHPEQRLRSEERSLALGTTLEREMIGEDQHSYRLDLDRGHYLRLELELEGTDALVTLDGPDGERLFEIHSYDAWGPVSPLTGVTELTGVYRLGIHVLPRGRRPGRYKLSFAEKRPALAADRQRLAADRLMADGTHLYKQQQEDALSRAYEKYQEALAILAAIDDQRGTSQALFTLGELSKEMGEQPQAFEFYRRAFEIQRRRGDRPAQALTLVSLAWLYHKTGQPGEALAAVSKALAIFSEIGHRLGRAYAHDKLGQIYRALGRFEEAVTAYRQALALLEGSYRLGARATTLNNLALVFDDLDEPQTALDLFRRALATMQEIDLRRGEASVYSNLGRLVSKFGDQEQALAFCLKALELFQEIGDRRYEARVAGNCGTFHAKSGHFEQALAFYERALELDSKTADPQSRAFISHRKADAARELGRLHEALRYDQEALELFRRIGHRQGAAQTESGSGETYRLLGEIRNGRPLLEQALAETRALGSSSDEARTLYRLALLERQAGDLDLARSRLEEAFGVIDSLRFKVVSPHLRTSLRSAAEDYYGAYVDLLMELHTRWPERGLAAVALEAHEKARARGLLELLHEARIDVESVADPELLARRRELRRRLNASERERATLSSRGSPDPERWSALQDEVDKLIVQYREVADQIRAENPRYAALTRPRPVNLENIRQVLNSGSLFLVYALGRERSFLWAVTPGDLPSFELPPRAEIEAAARRVYQLLTARNRQLEFETPAEKQRRVRDADQDYSASAAVLSTLLLQPVADLLGDRRLVIVSDGALQYLPFGALPDPGHLDSPLLANHEVTYLPSISVLAAIRQPQGQRASKSVAVLADPVFQRGDPRLRRPVAEAGRDPVENLAEDLLRAARELGFAGFSRLSATREEAKAILAAAPGVNLEALDFAANRRTALSSELSRYRIVHFATHSMLNDKHPELSGLVLSLVDETGEPVNGFLRMHEVYNLRLSADLVVLSACRTALGKEFLGEGLIGLTRGFLYAGADAVVASLWSPPDRATAELMTRFYRAMFKENLAPAAALRSAQVSMWRDPTWSPPYYWAAFVLQGEFADSRTGKP